MARPTGNNDFRLFVHNCFRSNNIPHNSIAIEELVIEHDRRVSAEVDDAVGQVVAKIVKAKMERAKRWAEKRSKLLFSPLYSKRHVITSDAKSIRVSKRSTPKTLLGIKGDKGAVAH